MIEWRFEEGKPVTQLINVHFPPLLSSKLANEISGDRSHQCTAVDKGNRLSLFARSAMLFLRRTAIDG
ncbi:hypothetical protein ABEV41_06620, partial [Geobacillus thermodenitrificans]|uniref:hypothetical protein n=1 Tax=Geobacillus thermodenitrificans TaxID=33940 RepID=UPI003D23368C